MAAPVGLNGLVFGTEDATATCAAMRRNAVPIDPPNQFSRPVEITPSETIPSPRSLPVSHQSGTTPHETNPSPTTPLATTPPGVNGDRNVRAAADATLATRAGSPSGHPAITRDAVFRTTHLQRHRHPRRALLFLPASDP